MIVILLLLTVVGIVVFERTLTVRSSKRKRLDGSSPRDDGRDDRVAGLHSNKEG